MFDRYSIIMDYATTGLIPPGAETVCTMAKVMTEAKAPCLLFSWMALNFYCAVYEEWVRGAWLSLSPLLQISFTDL